MERFSKTVRPLTDKTRKDASPNFTDLTTFQREAFDILKQRITSPSVLALPKSGPPYPLHCDASTYSLGCALLQKQPDGTLRPVGYWFYSLNETERDYHVTERECCAVVCATTSLHPYMEGTRFTVCTDRGALLWLMALLESSGRLTRWRLRVAELYSTIDCRPERVHIVANAVPRLVPTGPPPQTVHHDIPTFENPLILSRPHATARTVPTLPPTVDGYPDDGVSLVSTCAQRALAGTDPPINIIVGYCSGPHQYERT